MPVRQEQTCGPGLQRGQAASSGGNAWRRRPEPKLGSVVGNHAFLTSFCHGCYMSVVGLVAPLPARARISSRKHSRYRRRASPPYSRAAGAIRLVERAGTALGCNPA